jgi:peptide/nickel transport system substrate-binding protein
MTALNIERILAYQDSAKQDDGEGGILMDKQDQHSSLGRLSRRDLLRAGALTTGLAWAGGMLGTPGWAFAQETPKRGGRLRIGSRGGGANETLNPMRNVNEVDIFRVHLLYERLFNYDSRGGVVNQLAAEASPNKDATVWRIKLQPGVEWHDGSRLTANDVVYSLQYIATKANNAMGYTELSYINPSDIQRRDASTVEIRLEQPNALLPTSLAARTIWIIKEGTTTFDRPIGTGPFKLQSFTPGARSLLVRNGAYRKHNGPYLDAVEIISFSNETARLNALQTSEIDVMDEYPLQLAKTVPANGPIRLLRAPRAFTLTMYMAIDTPPFDDNRVRQAFRLMVDREQMVKTILGDLGVVGNDLFWPTDPDYASALPQRAYDPEQAKSLLKAAGKDNLSVSIYTADAGPGMLDSATILAEQAKRAGVSVTLDKVPGDQYYSDKYLKAAFGQGGWSARPLTTQFAQVLNSTAPYNETHWKRPDFDKLTNEARRTIDPKKRHELWVEAQTLLWNEGGYIIWGFQDYVDGYWTKVHGLKASVARWLGNYDLTDVYLS